jgi:hypothetical protein
VAASGGRGAFRAALARGGRASATSSACSSRSLLTLVAWLVLYVVGIGLILLAATIGGVQPGDPFGLTDLAVVPVLIASGGWAVLVQVGIGFAVSFISRSAVAGIATVVGLVFIEQFAAMLAVPADLLLFAPVTAATRLVKAAGDAGLDASIGVPLVDDDLSGAPIGMVAVVARRAQSRDPRYARVGAAPLTRDCADDGSSHVPPARAVTVWAPRRDFVAGLWRCPSGPSSSMSFTRSAPTS